MHLDLVSADRPAAVERALGLGATKVGDFDEYGTQWTTLADPEGNVFDIGVPHEDASRLAQRARSYRLREGPRTSPDTGPESGPSASPPADPRTSVEG